MKFVSKSKEANDSKNVNINEEPKDGCCSKPKRKKRCDAGKKRGPNKKKRGCPRPPSCGRQAADCKETNDSKNVNINKEPKVLLCGRLDCPIETSLPRYPFQLFWSRKKLFIISRKMKLKVSKSEEADEPKNANKSEEPKDGCCKKRKKRCDAGKKRGPNKKKRGCPRPPSPCCRQAADSRKGEMSDCNSSQSTIRSSPDKKRRKRNSSQRRAAKY